MLEHPFEVCCRLSKIAFFRLIYHSNVMLLTTVLTTFNKPIYLPIYLSSLPRILSFRFFFTHSLSLFLSSNSIHSLIFMTTPVVKNVDNACRIYVMYNLMALNDWLSGLHTYRWFHSLFSCLCVHACVLWLLQLDSKWLFAICICSILESPSFPLYRFLEMTLISFRFANAYVPIREIFTRSFIQC